MDEFPKIVKYDVPFVTLSNPLVIYLLFDVHYFSSQCERGILEKALKEIENTENARVIIGGDFFDAILPTDKRFDFNILPKEAFENLTNLKYMLNCLEKRGLELLEPIKDKVIVYITGNHEEKAAKLFFYDLAGSIGEKLKFPVFGYHAYVILSFRTDYKTKPTYGRLRLYVHHGWGAGRLPGSKINNLLKMSWDIDADIYVSGHTHSYIIYRKTYLTDVGEKLVEKERVFIKVPGLRRHWQTDKRETSFEERRAFSYPYKGVPRLKIYYRQRAKKYYVEVLP